MTADWFTPAITTDHRQDAPKNSHRPADRSHILPQTLRDPRWSIGGPNKIPIPKLQDTPRTYRLWGENQIKSYLCRLPTTVTNKDLQRSPTKIYIYILMWWFFCGACYKGGLPSLKHTFDFDIVWKATELQWCWDIGWLVESKILPNRRGNCQQNLIPTSILAPNMTPSPPSPQCLPIHPLCAHEEDTTSVTSVTSVAAYVFAIALPEDFRSGCLMFNAKTSLNSSSTVSSTKGACAIHCGSSELRSYCSHWCPGICHRIFKI